MADAPESAGLLNSVVTGRENLRPEYRLRRDTFEYMSIRPAQEDQFIAKGWLLHRQGTSRVRLRRPKSHDQLLEDRLWVLLYKMGYPVLSSRGFRIRYKRKDGSTGEKQIDVFAKDDETCLVIECKSCEQRRKRSLQKDLHETEALKKGLADSIRKHFGPKFQPKIIWLYATTNIIWSEQDLERAEASNVRVVTENELQYFDAFIDHIGAAGRYQFLAEFLEGQDIPNLSNVKVPAVKGAFGKHSFYSFVITPRHLLKIAFVNHQALNHPDGRPAYQRMINKNRIKKIGAFISNGGFFPTNILVNFTEKCRFDLLPNNEAADKSLKFGWLYLPNKYKSAWVVDGQHRLYGFSNLEDKLLDRSIFVLAFERMDNQTEAELFITINHEQKSVPKNLLIALQADLKLDSNEPKEKLSALGSALVKSLSVDPSSPLFGRVSVPGITPNDSQNLTIPELVKGLTRSTVVGRVIQRKSLAPGYLSDQTDRKTIDRARKVLNGYFRAVMDASPQRWAAGRSAYICVNPGIRAHLQLINEALRTLEAKGTIDPYQADEDVLVKHLVDFTRPIQEFVRGATDQEISAQFSRKFGEGGVVEYLFNLYDLIQKKHPNFGPKDYHDNRTRQTDARAREATQQILDIQEMVGRAVVGTLKKIHGTNELKSGEKAYWDNGIENLDIKQAAYKKQQMQASERRGPKEAYLDFVDYIKIIKQHNNWESFRPIFNLQMPGEKGGKTYYLEWMEKFNELRRVAAHRTSGRTFEAPDYEFLDWLRHEIYPRLESAGFTD